MSATDDELMLIQSNNRQNVCNCPGHNIFGVFNKKNYPERANVIEEVT